MTPMLLCRSDRTLRKPDSSWSWFVCACATVSNGLVNSVVLSYGVMMPILMEEFNDNKERTALVGSLAFAIGCFTCLVGGRLCDRLGCQVTHLIGILTCVVSLLISSWATSIMFLYVSYSITYGLGFSSVYMACYISVCKNVRVHSSFALGLVSAGTAAGVFAMGPSLQSLVDTLGWRNAYRIIAGMLLLCGLLSYAFDSNVEKEIRHIDQQELTEVAKRKKLIVMDVTMCKIPTYTLSVLSMSVAAFGHFSLPIHLVRHCEEMGFSGQEASYLFLGIGICSAVSRLGIGRICDLHWVNPVYINLLADLCSGTVTLLLTLRVDYGVLVVLTLFYGLADGAFLSTFTILALNTVPPKQRACAFGFANLGLSFSIATGPAITGLIADRFSYTYGFYMCGSVTLAGAMILPLLLCFKKKAAKGEPLIEIEPLKDSGSTSELVVYERETVL